MFNKELLVGRPLKAARALAGLSQAHLGKIIGRSQTWISFLESEKLLPQPEQARKIIRIFGRQ